MKKIRLLEGCKAVKAEEVKDNIEIVGCDIEAVSQSCIPTLPHLIGAMISQTARVKHKDNRKFLDGVYVSEQGYVDAK